MSWDLWRLKPIPAQNGSCISREPHLSQITGDEARYGFMVLLSLLRAKPL